MATIDPQSLLVDLDEGQAQVATSFGTPLAVLAGAGSGKTRAITHRIAYGIVSGEYEANSVLSLTFTTRAAGELRERLAYLGVPQVAARTFHSAALRQVRFFWPKVFHTDFPQVTPDRQGLILEAVNRLALNIPAAAVRDIASEISWAKVSNVTPSEYEGLARQHNRTVEDLEPYWVGRVLGRYEQVKNERGVVDFDDILLCACALLAENSGVAQEVRSSYHHLVVDEYQDVNPLQHTLLRLWLGDEPDICVVGDAAQTIHSFAGATSSYLTRFRKDYPDAQLLRLDRDYRSSPQIVELANQVATRNQIGGGLRLHSAAPAGPQCQIVQRKDEEAEVDFIVDWLSKQRNPLTWDDMAVLFRTHAAAEPVAAALKAGNIPFRIRDLGAQVDVRSSDPDSIPKYQPSGVTLATLHAAKGLEWEAVVLAGAQEGTLPHPLALTDEQVEEEARLFYVGVTRAKSRLLITWSSRRRDRSSTRARTRFLAGL
ncbi:MAG: ATP-dependent helicase [Propionibacteriaceae bacterium]|nr:ATP-dependent helicase [Propionibacteriaceae bacterium]